MADRRNVIIAEQQFESNFIPSGKQLARTPPMPQVKKKLNFCSDCEVDGISIGQAVMHFTPAQQRNRPTKSEHGQNATSFNTPERAEGFQTPFGLNRTLDLNLQTPKPRIGSTTICAAASVDDDPKSVLKGMEGYELTETDQEFIETLKKEKLIKKLQAELAEVERLLKSETMALDLTQAINEKMKADLKEFPSIEETTELAKVFLTMTIPLAELSDLNPRSLLALVKKEDVERAITQKREAVAQLEEMVLVMLADRKKVAEKETQLKRQNIHGMMNQLSNLKSELAKEEETYKGLQMEIVAVNATEIPTETKNGDAPEEQQSAAIKGRIKLRSSKTEPSQATANQCKPTKGRVKFREADGESSDSTSLTNSGNRKPRKSLRITKEQAKQTPGDAGTQKLLKSLNAATVPRNVKEPVPQRTVTRRRKADASETTTALESQALRRSKRKVTTAAYTNDAHVDQNPQRSLKPVSAKVSKTSVSQDTRHVKTVEPASTPRLPLRRTTRKAPLSAATGTAEEVAQNPEPKRSKRIAKRN